MRIKFILPALVVSIGAFFNGSVLAQTTNDSDVVIVANNSDAEKIKNIKKLLELTDTESTLKQVVNQMISQIKTQNPNISPNFLNTFINEYKTEEVLDRMIPIYSKYYTNEEIEGMIAFYQTPLGQKTIKVMPQLMTESIQIGQIYAQEVAQRAMNKIKNELPASNQ